MADDKDTKEEDASEDYNIEVSNRTKPDLTDFVALTIALLETTLLPFVFLVVAWTVIYLTIMVATTGLLWLIVLYPPLIALPILTRRFLRWRRLEKTKASLK